MVDAQITAMVTPLRPRVLVCLVLAAGASGCAAAAPALRGAESRVVRLAPGVRYLEARDPRGPWAMHVIEVDTVICAPRWEVRKAAESLASRAPTSALAQGALATVNGDFFQLPGGTPVGAHVHRGRVWIGPGDRPAWLASGRAMAAGPTRLDGQVTAEQTPSCWCR
jgi:hypothetical protein